MTRLLAAACVLWLARAARRGAVAPRSAGRTRPPAVAAHAGALVRDLRQLHGVPQRPATPLGEDVSIGSTWRASMMANSARDPVLAGRAPPRSRSTTRRPPPRSRTNARSATCRCCSATAHAAGGAGRHLRAAADRPQSRLRGAARWPRTACRARVCHQIRATKLGTRESFNGGFVMQPTPASGTRPIFGPFKIDRGRTTIMRSVIGLRARRSRRTSASRSCARPATRSTRRRAAQTAASSASFPSRCRFRMAAQRVPAPNRSCQSCHMPAVSGSTRIASVLGEQREGLARHTVRRRQLLHAAHAEPVPDRARRRGASPELEATARATLRQLETETAVVSIDRADRERRLDRGRRSSVRNLTGHKLPTGYPSRRAWLHLTVRDAAGQSRVRVGRRRRRRA